MLLMIDNYDSFTYNVVQYLGELGADVHVIRNDELSISEIEALKPERIVVSPGPCTPTEAGVSIESILTEQGHEQFANFLKQTGGVRVGTSRKPSTASSPNSI